MSNQLESPRVTEQNQTSTGVHVGTGERRRSVSYRTKMLSVWMAAGLMVLIGGIGSYFLFLSHADSGPPKYMIQTPGIVVSRATDLDGSGVRVPDSAYHLSNGCDVTGATDCPKTVFMAPNGSDASTTGSKASPVKTLDKAIGMMSDGWTLVVRGGTYEDWYSDGAGNPGKLTKSISIQAYPHEQVWFTGMNVIPTSAWSRSDSTHWALSWNTPSFCGGAYYSRTPTTQTANGPCAVAEDVGGSDNLMAADPQMVRVDSTTINEVERYGLTASQHSFFYDFGQRRLFIPYDPSGRTIRVTARPTALQVYASNVKILGIGFRDYATNQYNNATQGAVVLYGNDELVQNDAFTGMAGAALRGSTSLRSRVSHSAFVNNGFNGISWNGSRAPGNTDADLVVIENSLFSHNNDELFATKCSAACNAANVKMAHINGATIRGNVFHGGQGVFTPGYWCDLNCNRVNIIGNLAQGNAGPGIMYEVSNNGIIASNMVINNSLRSTGYPGIMVSSAGTQIYNNTVVGNTHTDLNGIWVYDDSRTPSTDPDVGADTNNVAMANNIIETDGIGLSAFGPSGSAAKAPNRGADGLFSILDYDAYFVPSGPVLGTVKWQHLGDNPVNYKILGDFVNAKHWETHGGAQYSIPASGLPFFVDAVHGNYNIVAGSGGYARGGPIPADVAAQMGVSTAAGQNRGALNWPGK